MNAIMPVNEGMFKKKKKGEKKRKINQKTKQLKSKKKQNNRQEKKITKLKILKFFQLGTSFKLRALIYILKAPHLKKKPQISWI